MLQNLRIKMLTTGDCQKLKTVLENAGCCPRCILRYFGERTYSIYSENGAALAEISKRCASSSACSDSESQSEVTCGSFKTGGGNENSESQDDGVGGSCKTEEADKILMESSSSPPAKRKLLSSCSCCLNVLQSGCDSDTVQMVIDAVCQGSHQFQSFVLQLSMPPSVELREVLMNLFLKEKYRDLYEKCSELDVPSVRDTWKWCVGPLVASHFTADCSPKSAFSISVKMSHPDLEAECKPLRRTLGDFPNGRNKTLEEIYNRSAVTRAVQKYSDTLKQLYALPPGVPSCPVQVDSITCSHQPIYLAGRYNKFSRELSQTPWVVDGAKRLVSSVEERIADVVLKHIRTEKIIFSSSGREDVDVRMLGDGRPFVLELINPKTVILTKEFLRNLQDEVNRSTEDIAVKDLQVVNKDDLQNLKEGEEEKRKVYSAVCCISRPLTPADSETIAGLRNLEVYQKTPIRVLHRRTQAVRKRLIFSMALEKTDDFRFTLRLETQAGTYVKEFVHGDFGRTKPSLGDLLNAETDIIELDVERVELDWPPPL